MLDEKSSNTTSVVVLCTAPDEATAQDLAAKVLAESCYFAALPFLPDYSTRRDVHNLSPRIKPLLLIFSKINMI